MNQSHYHNLPDRGHESLFSPLLYQVWERGGGGGAALPDSWPRECGVRECVVALASGGTPIKISAPPDIKCHKKFLANGNGYGRFSIIYAFIHI